MLMTPTCRPARNRSRSCFVIVSDTAPSLQLLGQRPDLLHPAADLSAALVEHALLDHVTRLEEQCLWNCQPESLGSLEVDDKVELRRLLDGKLARLRAFQDAVRVVRRAPVCRRKVRSVREQAPGFCEILVDRDKR